MRSINNETRQTMNSRRNFVNYATMTLMDGTVLHLKPSDFRLSGQSFTDDWVDGDTFQIGTAIGKTATLLLDNTDGREENTFELQTSEPVDWSINYNDYYTFDGGFYYPLHEEEAPTWVADTYYTLTNTITYPHGKFSEYDFYMAYFSLYVCLPDAFHLAGELKDEMIPIGIFTVTTPTAHGATIEIIGVDNMYLFDRSFDQCGLDFTLKPNLRTIINRCCEDCNVAIGYSQEFTNWNLTVSERPESTTYRQVISWVAQIAGSNATITATGALTLKSYDMSALAGLDDGTFINIGEEFQYRQGTWDGIAQGYSSIGYNTYFASNVIRRSGTYKVTKVVIDEIEDPTNFNAEFQIFEYDSFNQNMGSNTTRYNSRKIKSGPLVAGENIVNQEITIISNSNATVYWIGVYQDNTNPNASKFRYTYFLEPVSYADGDSCDGGSFEPERYVYRDWNGVSGTTIGDIQYRLQTFICPGYIGVPGKYKFTRIRIYNIVDPTHFNPVYLVQKSVDSGTTWTDEDNGPIVAGDNTINYQFELPNNNSVRFRIMVGQDIVADPSATKFDIDFCFKADDDLYLDGDTLDGGNFNYVLGFHNLVTTKGTSICTDDVKFTGVEVINDELAVHYPTSTGWDNYSMVIEDNPFTKGYESAVAHSIYNALSGLNFRPFSTSSLQDPTIEAGDPCIVYDVKGGMYFSIVTNVKFKTGGVTDVSCNAEPPVRQISQYTSSSSYARRKQIEYSSQVEHFNQIASEALGYYKTEQADTDTGATITYLHNLASLDDSDIVVKIANGIVAISDNYNTPQRSWNTGFDASTGTMLLNLIYVHGLTADWINTGALNVGGLDNVDGVIHVANRFNVSNPIVMVDPDTSMGFFVGPGQINISGSYKIFYDIYDFESGKPEHVVCMVQKRDKWDGSTYTWKTIQTYYPLISNSGELPMMFEVDTSDGDMYYYVTFSRISTTNALFTGVLSYNKINTIIDRNGIKTSAADIAGKITASSGSIDGTLSIGPNGEIGSYGSSSDMKAAHIARGDLGISVEVRNHSWGALAFGKEVRTRLDWPESCLVLWNGGDGDAGFHVVSGSPNSQTSFSALKQSSLQFWVNYNLAYYYDTGGGHSGSDRRLKKDIEPLDVEKIRRFFNAVNPVSFEFKSDNAKRFGIIAQELNEALNDAELQNDIIIEETPTEEKYLSVAYSEFHGLELAGIKDLYNKINEQQKEIDDLKKRLDKLEGK